MLAAGVIVAAARVAARGNAPVRAASGAGAHAPETDAPSSSSTTAAPTTTTTVPIPPEWHLVERNADGFAIGLPPGWTEVAPEAAALDRAIKDVAKVSPAMAPGVQAARQAVPSGQVKLFAYETAGAQSEVEVLKVPGTADVDNLGVGAASGLSKLGAKDIDHHPVMVGATPVVRTTYDLPVNVPNQPAVVVHGIQFAVPHAGNTIIIGFTTVDATQLPKADDIAQTLRLV